MPPKKKKVLEGHKQVGKKLIPPILQLPNLVFTTFKNDQLPNLIWISALFLRSNEKVAVQFFLDFLGVCNEILNDERLPPLVFLSNFNTLTNQQKQSLIDGLANRHSFQFLINQLNHQNFLFADYPLKFLFASYNNDLDSAQCIEYLEQDVEVLLDRYSSLATKVQVTSVVGMLTTGKMFFTKEVEIPDFNSIFTNPNSEEAKRAASFARANLNAGFGYDSDNRNTVAWAKSFWKQSFNLSECK